MRLLAFDLETHKIQPGLIAPPIVCGSLQESFVDQPELLSKDKIIEYLDIELKYFDKIAGANIAYDFGCLLAEKPNLLPMIWELYEKGKIHDVQISAVLEAIAEGRIHDSGLFRKDGTKIQSGRYSLEECVREYTGRSNAKANDRYRTSYALLEGSPIAEWPIEARQYPCDDAKNTFEIAEIQLTRCHNLNNVPFQSHFAFCAHLSAIYGFRTDPKAVQLLEQEIESNLEALTKFAKDKGFLVWDKKKWVKKKAVLQAAVMKAYDGSPPLTETGQIATEREVLQDSGDKDLETLSELSRWEKLKGTYLPVLKQGIDRPINIGCNPVIATGRASFEGLIQLMPRKGNVRSCIVARNYDSYEQVPDDYQLGPNEFWVDSDEEVRTVWHI